MTKGSVDSGLVFHAGFPNAAEDGNFGSLNLDSLVVKHRVSTFFWRLEVGIEEMHWPKGSVLVVDRALEPKEGNIVVAVSDDGFLLCWFHKKGFERFSGEPIDAALWGVVTFCIQPTTYINLNALPTAAHNPAPNSTRSSTRSDPVQGPTL